MNLTNIVLAAFHNIRSRFRETCELLNAPDRVLAPAYATRAPQRPIAEGLNRARGL